MRRHCLDSFVKGSGVERHQPAAAVAEHCDTFRVHVGPLNYLVDTANCIGHTLRQRPFAKEVPQVRQARVRTQ